MDTVTEWQREIWDEKKRVGDRREGGCEISVVHDCWNMASQKQWQNTSPHTTQLPALTNVILLLFLFPLLSLPNFFSPPLLSYLFFSSPLPFPPIFCRPFLFYYSYGMRQTVTGTDYAVASESVAIDALDTQFKLARDVAAGEAIFISLKVCFCQCVYVWCIICVLYSLRLSVLCGDLPSLYSIYFRSIVFLFILHSMSTSWLFALILCACLIHAKTPLLFLFYRENSSPRWCMRHPYLHLACSSTCTSHDLIR
jgi:hypothetical protein